MDGVAYREWGRQGLPPWVAWAVVGVLAMLIVALVIV
jgi:hypothetical protein